MKAVFFDRDGTLNADENGYINDPGNFHLLQSASEVLNYLKLLDYKIFIISNQSGIGRGLIKPEAYRKVTNKFLTLVNGYNVIDDILYCPHLPSDNCRCRKPETMLLDIIREQYDINLKKSYFVGDKLADVICGRRMGLNTILIRTRKNKKINDQENSAVPDIIINSLQELMSIIIS